MTSAELKLVANHMGHNINIHTDFYRLQSSLLEKTKVARMLIALENGQMNRFQGRNLESISVNGKWLDTSRKKFKTQKLI
jgi:hypothetical protein